MINHGKIHPPQICTVFWNRTLNPDVTAGNTCPIQYLLALRYLCIFKCMFLLFSKNDSFFVYHVLFLSHVNMYYVLFLLPHAHIYSLMELGSLSNSSRRKTSILSTKLRVRHMMRSQCQLNEWMNEWKLIARNAETYDKVEL